MKRQISMLAVPLVAGLLFVAGCSDDNEPPPPSGPTNTPVTVNTNTPTVVVVATATRTHTVAVNTPTNTVPPATPTNTPEGNTPTATSTGVVEETPTPTATGGEATATNTPGGEAICGNGVTDPDSGETCDDGNNYGGDGCAANCTTEGAESDLLLNYGTASTSTSFSIVQAVAFALNLTVSGSQVVTHGTPRTDASIGADGHTNFAPGDVPLVGSIEKNQDRLDPIQIPGIACACLRGIQLSTCGGLTPVPGQTDIICNMPDGTADPSLCTNPEAPCVPAFGPGISAAGVVGCNGLTNVDYVVTNDSSIPPPNNVTFEPSGGPVEVGALNSAYTAIGVIMGNPMCIEDTSNANNGPDGLPCTDDDPVAVRGVPSLNLQTTGSAAAVVLNANGVSGKTIAQGEQCGASECQASATGAPKACEALVSGDTSGLCLVSAFASLDQPSLGDIAVPAKFCAQ